MLSPVRTKRGGYARLLGFEKKILYMPFFVCGDIWRELWILGKNIYMAGYLVL